MFRPEVAKENVFLHGPAGSNARRPDKPAILCLRVYLEHVRIDKQKGDVETCLAILSDASPDVYLTSGAVMFFFSSYLEIPFLSGEEDGKEKLWFREVTAQAAMWW